MEAIVTSVGDFFGFTSKWPCSWSCLPAWGHHKMSDRGLRYKMGRSFHAWPWQSRGHTSHVKAEANETYKIVKESYSSVIVGKQFCAVVTDDFENYADKKGYPKFDYEQAKVSAMKENVEIIYYSLLTNDCEHHVTKWKYGTGFTLQFSALAMIRRCVGPHPTLMFVRNLFQKSGDNHDNGDANSESVSARDNVCPPGGTRWSFREYASRRRKRSSL